MQNRYSGDVGDFSKLGLLRRIASAGLVVGINWYLVEDETHNEDGKHIGFLDDKQYYDCDDELRDALGTVVGQKRCVSAIEEQNLIDKASYFSELLMLPKTKGFSRHDWHSRALEVLENADIVFLDPDNGVLPKSVTTGRAKGIKYVFREEVDDYYAAGQSVVFYNHRSRVTEEKYLHQFDWMFADSILRSARVAGLKFIRGTIRDYLFAIQPRHEALVIQVIEDIMKSPWSKHFVPLHFES